ncbi:MAG: alanine racemase, partial [Thermoleophilaceae bacterium]|nr:alanine racemase [Thermoleophilaceae bacterium]
MAPRTDIQTTGLSAPQRAVASINLDAITANCALLADSLAESSSLCAVVKADGYGHGIVQSAQAALRGGATRLAVVTVGEAQQLAEADFAVPVLIMAPLTAAELEAAIATGAELMVWERSQVEAISAAAQVTGGGEVKLHIKRDTGMGRYGARSDAEAL